MNTDGFPAPHTCASLSDISGRENPGKYIEEVDVERMEADHQHQSARPEQRFSKYAVWKDT